MSVKKNIKLLTWFNFLINLNFFTPIAIIYFERTTGSFALAASIFSVITVSSAIFEIPTGIFSDMVGRKKTIVLGTLFALLSLLMYTLGSSYWLFILGAIFHGACKACFSGNNDAYLHNLLETENLHEHYHHYRGRLETLFMIGTSIGALIGGFLANESLGLLWISIIPMLGALFISTQLADLPKAVSETKSIALHLKEAIIEIKNNANLRLLSISEILGSAFGPTASQFHPAVNSIFWPLWAVGLASALAEWIAIPGTYFSGKIIERFGAYRVMLFSSFYAWFANFIATIIPTKVTPLIISTSAVMWGPGDVASGSMFQKEFTERQRATIASLNSFVGSVFFAIFAYFIGVFADSYGPVKALLLIQVFIFPTLLLNWMLYRRNK